jgi:hypothetical protein
MNVTTRNHRQLIVIAGVAAIIYCIYYFVICRMPVIGTPVFRIDYFATTVSRADDSLGRSLLHARPISELYVYIQALISKNLLDGQSKLIIYPFQHLSLLVYFFSIALTVEFVLGTRLRPIAIIAAWILFITIPGVISDVYKLETIVGTLSKLFGGLSLVFICSWIRSRTTTSAFAFLICYALSIFSKEDFILPPLLLLGWHVLREGDWRAQIVQHKRLLIAITLILVGFLVFNKFLLPSRSYMDPAKSINAPYYMTLEPSSLFHVAIAYTFGLGLQIKILTILYAGALLAGVVLIKRAKEMALAFLMMGAFMAPYLIMPNHVFAYYALNWQAWQCVFFIALIQLISPRAWAQIGGASLTMALVLVPSIYGILRHQSIGWYQANYLRSKFSIGDNVRATLSRYRETINRQKEVGLVGIGPEGIAQSPWQNNGETAFYLESDFGLKATWLVFVKSSDRSYVIGAPTTKSSSLLTGPNVLVKDIKSIDQYKNIPLIVFDPDGNGRFIEHAGQISDVTRSMIAKPFSVPNSDKTIRRDLVAAEDYKYLHGFNESEGDNGRWLSASNVILLAPHAGDHFELVAYSPPSKAYVKKRPPFVTVSFDNCRATTREVPPGTLSTLVFAIPEACDIHAGVPTNVRIEVDNLIDTSKSRDNRSLSILGKRLGFVGAQP